MLRELENAMEEVEAQSSFCGYFYQLSDVLIIMVCGLLSNLQDIKRIHAWSQSKSASEFLEAEFGIAQIPCRSHFYNILACVNYEAFSKCFSTWMADVLSRKTESTIIAIDGKTICSTSKRSCSGNPLHIASALVSNYGFILASKECKTKLSEPDAFRELIELLDIRGTLIVADALHCQRKSAELVIEHGGDFLFVVKGNQLNLRKNVELFSYNKRDDEYTTIEKNGGRIETRTAYVANNIENFCDKDKWKNLACVGTINRQFEKKGGKPSNETHYYICSRNLSAKELLEYARSEWQVESMHWVLDVHFLEDKCKIFDMQLQKTMNLLRKVAINLIRKYKETQPKNTSLTTIMDNNLFDTEKFSLFLQYLRNCDM